ncbi:NrfD/PsrC family molybdoenzyme membrane anchor subunit [Chloroflexota bacterium]
MNKSIPYLKPQKEWEWQVATDVYLAGIGSGSLAVGILMDWLGYLPYSLRPFVLWGSILVAVGAFFLVLKLGIKRRFLNTILNPKTSWLSRGFYILSMCIIIGLVILGVSILPILGISISNWSSLFAILEIIGFVLALSVAIYTGILIRSVKYVPFWNTPLLPVLFTVSSLFTGSVAVILSTLVYSILTPGNGYPNQLMDTLTLIARILIVLEAIILGLYLFLRYKAEEEGQSSVRLLLSGKLKYVFWIGVIVAGFILPIILEGIYSWVHAYQFLPLLTTILLLIGRFFLRYGIVYAGVKDQHPLRKFIENQYDLSTLKDNRGQFLIRRAV